MSEMNDVPIGTYRIRPIKTWIGIRYVAERRGKFLFWRTWHFIDSSFGFATERDAEDAIDYHRMPVPPPRIVPAPAPAVGYAYTPLGREAR